MALINTADIERNCPFFGQGVEKTQKADVGIITAESKLKAVLCDETLDILATAVSSGTYPAGYVALYALVEKYLSWLAFAEYLKWSQVTDTDAGLRMFQESNSQDAESTRVDSYVRNAEETASVYKAEILYFLERNIVDFPEYLDSNCRKCGMESTYTGKISGAGSRKKALPRTFNNPF